MSPRIELRFRGPEENASYSVSKAQVAIFAILVVALVGALLRDLLLPLGIIVAAGIVVYFVVFCWRVATTHLSLMHGSLVVPKAELDRVARTGNLASITIMVPVRKERESVVINQAMAFSRLDYPRDKLQIMMLVDADDEATAELVQRHMPDWVEIRIIPTATPRTKPRVLNDGLVYAKGDIIGVWDGEDWPEPLQLLKVSTAFSLLPKDIVCLQGRLVFRESHHNMLTRWAAIAYHGSFSLFLPALANLNLPVPLGGTTNFIRAEALHTLNGWDSWNVTEDLDLGIRIARQGWKVRILETSTEEESNPSLGNCLNQWSRWEKGKMQTWLVHMRHPWTLLRELGPMGFFSFHLVVGVPILTLLMNPIYIFGSLLYVVASWSGGQPWLPPVLAAYPDLLVKGISTLFPPAVLYLGAFCQLVGNAYFTWLAATSAMYRKEHGLVPAALLSLGHWLLLSAATYKGLWQMFTRRAHHWELTQHGLMPNYQGVDSGMNITPTYQGGQ